MFLGKFQYRVTTKGEYSYWSGYTDLYEIVYYRGTLVVEDRQSFDGEVTLKVAGQLANHDINSGIGDLLRKKNLFASKFSAKTFIVFLKKAKLLTLLNLQCSVLNLTWKREITH